MATNSQQTTEILVFLPVKPAARDEFRAKLFEIADHIVKEPEFVSASIHEDLDDPDTLILREVWTASREDLLEELNKPYRTEYEFSLAALLKAERRIVFLSPPLAQYEV